MKKVDLHIHTIPTVSDKPFTYSESKLLEYIKTRSIDAIAITNHNCFDIEQYRHISAATSIFVIPGIEIDVENGHLIVLSDPNELGDFAFRCELIKKEIPDNNTTLRIQKFREIFPDLQKYVLIPHYDKNPNLPTVILEELRAFITVGEVSSPKKFIYCIKDRNELVPAYFSDLRIDKDLIDFPIRQTFVDIGDVTFSAIKFAFADKSKVSLSANAGHGFFQATKDGLLLSTGLNVVIGERSSGKTYTLDQLYNTFERVKYLKQFSLVERSDKDDADRFNAVLRQNQSVFIQNYFTELKECVESVTHISIEDDDRKIEKYLEDLKKNAQEIEKADAFSRATLFSETEFPEESTDNIKRLIDSVVNLAENKEYKAIIEEYIKVNVLQELAVRLMELFAVENENILKRTWVNDLLNSIKTELQRRTAATPIPEIDFYEIISNRARIRVFEKIALGIKEEREIYSQSIQAYRVVAKVKPFTGAGELKAISGRQLGFLKAYQEYNKPYSFLQKLKAIDGLQATEYYKFFAQIEYMILNRYGFEVSGGERSEFRLLQEISDALQYDLLLIDEPESSFDNVFLNTEVNILIKDISQKMPVVLVTHNSTVGASIIPDYLLFTKREFEGEEVNYKVFFGHPSDKTLKNLKGEEQSNYTVILDCLEAGNVAYGDRGRTYETLKN
jgi:ABC-type dipeptide/oligopeptide/nickel transport system ATPase component